MEKNMNFKKGFFSAPFCRNIDTIWEGAERALKNTNIVGIVKRLRTFSEPSHYLISTV